MLAKVKDMARQVSTCEKRKSLQEKRLWSSSATDFTIYIIPISSSIQRPDYIQ